MGSLRPIPKAALLAPGYSLKRPLPLRTLALQAYSQTKQWTRLAHFSEHLLNVLVAWEILMVRNCEEAVIAAKLGIIHNRKEGFSYIQVENPTGEKIAEAICQFLRRGTGKVRFLAQLDFLEITMRISWSYRWRKHHSTGNLREDFYISGAKLPRREENLEKKIAALVQPSWPKLQQIFLKETLLAEALRVGSSERWIRKGYKKITLY